MALCFFVLFGAACSPVYADAPAEAVRWHNATAIIVRDSADTPEFAADIGEYLGVPVVSRFNFPIQVSRFDGQLDSIPLSNLPIRLMDDDPRRDPFMDAAERFFSARWDDTEAHQLLVLHGAGDVTVRDIRTAVDRTTERRSDVEPSDAHIVTPRPAAVPVAYLAFLAIPFVLWIFRRERLWILLVTGCLYVSAVPVVRGFPLVFVARTVELLALLMVVFLHKTPQRFIDSLPKPMKLLFSVFSGVLFISATAGTLVAVFQYSRAWLMVPMLAGTASVMAVAWVRFLRPVETDHVLFVPVALVREPPDFLLPLATTVLLFALLFSAVQAGSGRAQEYDLTLSVPVALNESAERNHTPVERGIVEFEQASQNGFPMSLGTYLAHRFYQSALFHVSDRDSLRFFAPEPGYRIYQARFERLPHGGFQLRDEPVIEFDEQWFTSILDAAVSIPANMLLSEPGPMILLPTRYITGPGITAPRTYTYLVAWGLVLISVCILIVQLRQRRNRRLLRRTRTTAHVFSLRRAA